MSFFGFISKVPKKTTGGIALVVLAAAPITTHFEGLKLKAYLDPVGIPTICHGETENVKIGDEKTKEECDAIFEMRLGVFARGVDVLVKPDLDVKTHAALTSFTYNVGLKAFEKSTLLKKLNAGDFEGACNELPRWNKAGGKVFKGLTRRREAERKLCLEGVNEI